MVQAAVRYSLMSPAQVVRRSTLRPKAGSMTAPASSFGGVLVEGAVGAVGVVVVDVVGEEAAELAFVPDEGAVEELVAQGPDPAFGVGVGPWGLGVGW